MTTPTEGGFKTRLARGARSRCRPYVLRGADGTDSYQLFVSYLFYSYSFLFVLLFFSYSQSFTLNPKVSPSIQFKVKLSGLRWGNHKKE